MAKSYKVLVGINYGDKRAEPGDIVDDLPAGAAEWMLEDGIVEAVKVSRKDED